MPATKTKTKKAKKVEFVSRSPNLRIVVEPAQPTLRDPRGAVLMMGTSGREIQFEQRAIIRPDGIQQWGMYETSDPDEIAFLEAAEGYDTAFGFWRRGSAPGEARPTTAEQLSAIARASAEGNLDALNGVLESERVTHNRFEITAAAEAAIEAVEEQAAAKPEGKAKARKSAEAVTENGDNGGDSSGTSG
jgi:hypothetical protein